MADRPIVQTQRRPVAPQDVTRRRDNGGPMVNADRDVQGLLIGLSTFNGQLKEMVHTEMKRTADTATAAGTAAAIEGKPLDPSQAPFAFGDNYELGYRTAVSQRAALKAKQDYLDEAASKVHEPDFNPTEFSDKWWSAQFAGNNDPVATPYIGAAREEADVAIRKGHRDAVMARATETETEALNLTVQNNLTPDMTPQELHAAWGQISKDLDTRGFTRLTKAERARVFYQRIASLSHENGGLPELFSALTDFADPDTGMSIAAHNKDVAAAVAVDRARAADQREKQLREDTTSDRVVVKADLLDRINRGERMGAEFYAQMISPIGFTEADAMSMLQHEMTASAKIDKLAVARGYAEKGQLRLMSPEEQRGVLDEAVADLRAPLAEALQKGDAAKASQVIKAILDKRTAWGGDEYPTVLKSVFDGAPAAMPKAGEEPSPNFTALHTVFESMPDNVRRTIMREDAYRMFEAYTTARNAGVPPVGAAAAAARATDPKALAEAKRLFREDKEWHGKAQKIAKDAVAGTAKVLSYLPGASYAGWEVDSDESVRVGRQVEDFAYNLYLSNPHLTPKQIEAEATRFVQSNFLMVRSGLSTRAVQVPPAMNNETTQKAMQEFFTAMEAKAKVDKRGDNWGAVMAPDGRTPGAYSVWLSDNGVRMEPVGTVDLKQLRDDYVAKRTLTPEDRNTIGALDAAISNGTATSALVDAARPAMAKLELTGKLPNRIKHGAAQFQVDQLKKGIEQVIKVDVPAPKLDTLMESPKRVNKSAAIDRRLTAQTAEAFLKGDLYGRDHKAMAAAIITAREEVVLHAYPDPAKGAGMNIGMGYNFKHNAKTLHADLKSAGVPAEQIERVIKGELQITPRQAMNLTQQQVGRYEKEAVKAVGPDIWARLQPNVKAVLIDVAWQSGTPAKFQSALTALKAGDMVKFGEELKVHYRNQSGQMVPDKRGNDMRQALLADPVLFRKAVTRYGS